MCPGRTESIDELNQQAEPACVGLSCVKLVSEADRRGENLERTEDRAPGLEKP
jgi:hypothetical protein